MSRWDTTPHGRAGIGNRRGWALPLFRGRDTTLASCRLSRAAWSSMVAVSRPPGVREYDLPRSNGRPAGVCHIFKLTLHMYATEVQVNICFHQFTRVYGNIHTSFRPETCRHVKKQVSLNINSLLGALLNVYFMEFRQLVVGSWLITVVVNLAILYWGRGSAESKGL